jgi:recombination protein RecR
METLRRLQQLFKRFPGIGERQAMRFAYFIATADESYVKDLSESIASIRKNVRRCTQCFALSENISGGLCPVCADPARDTSMLLVVEKDADRDRFMHSKTYSGNYFILGGLAPAIEKDAHRHIRLEELSRLADSSFKNGLKEIILALSATPDGDRTEALIRLQLEKIKSEKNIVVSVLGKGLSTGTEIEYSDAETLSSALRSRTHE